ncbi:Wzz/FepE/Etk N-terminal domain-containing protein [Labilibacter marinus]|uniref:Wzz/FepE/Etk N-terminal domain-containing protein n=1 Tax=Labilibacter marinus TaxID=1477105 RepID=UPI00094FEFDC|nr:Wzz/FepE/Etk N-terminal domain-containing protein [Labilibacter marinus]
MTLEENKERAIIKDDEIDLIALVKTIWDGRKIIYYSVGICVLIGLIIAFTSPDKYTASATLLPSAEKKASNLGGLGDLAGMAGINLGSMLGDASGIPAEIYPQVVKSYPFQREMIMQQYNFRNCDTPKSFYEYIVSDSVESVGDILLKYTIKLPWTLKDAIFKEVSSDNKLNKTDVGVIFLTEKEKYAYEMIQESVQLNVDKKTGIVSVFAQGNEAIVTAQFVEKTVELLQDYMIKYKTKQSRQSLEFITKQFDEKKVEYESIQKKYFNYKDQHRNTISERVDIEYQRLRDEYEIISNVYKGLAQQLEQAKITVVEETPAFTIIDPAIVPIDKSSPRKVLILIISGFFGVLLGIASFFLRNMYYRYV